MPTRHHQQRIPPGTHWTRRVRALLVATVLGVWIVSGLPASAASSTVATFESISIYWSPAGAGPDKTASVRYRPSGTGSWVTAQSLWYDGRTSPSPPYNPAGEYKGSIVGLLPGTNYEIEVSIAGGAQEILTAKTWSEEFPIAETITLPANSSNMLVLDQSGSASGYLLYTAPPGGSATIDVSNSKDHNIEIKASYVIVRGLTLRGARSHAIYVTDGNRTNIVIEENDISGWGHVNAQGYGVGYDAGIRAEDSGIKRMVIQRNRIHHPRGDTNSWCENPDTGETDSGCGSHPEGPHAVRMSDTGGNHVIRYNTVDSDEQHYFADGIGGGSNFSYEGFPGPDSDVHGNYIERCWDNAIEAEGAGINVRIWGNYMDRTYAPMGLTPVAVGPTYVWRNVFDRCRKGPESASGDSDGDPRGKAFKFGAGSEWGGGRVYIYHNTVLQRSAPSGLTYPLGVKDGISTSATGGGAYNLIARNNILQVHKSSGNSVSDSSSGSGNEVSSFDYDLYNGDIDSPLSQESHGVDAKPVYASGNGPLEFFLASSSPGLDDGIALPNFNDGAHGSGPDMGAYEAGALPLEFGMHAYEQAPSEPPPAPENVQAN